MMNGTEPTDDSDRAKRAEGQWTGVGVAMGAGVGMIIGLLIAGGSGLALGICFGAGVGVVVGAAADAQSRRGSPDEQ